MGKVITYGTYDLLHEGHINLLKRAKALGDYLIVGITAEDFDKNRGKINVSQSLMERVAAVKETGLADEIIVEGYEGQKIDDILRYDIDIFAIGSDWEGKFDYLNEYCKVVYLPRTPGISSSKLRTVKRKVRLGLVGDIKYLRKFANECRYVNGVEVVGICTRDTEKTRQEYPHIEHVDSNYNMMLENVDALYVVSHPSLHYNQIKTALSKGKHVLCESPIALKKNQCEELFNLARENNCILMDGIKTAYSTAYSRLLLLLKSGVIGKIVSVNATCTSLSDVDVSNEKFFHEKWNSICAWGTVAMLPVFQLFGTQYQKKIITSNFADKEKTFDTFTKIDFIYNNSVASVLVGKGAKAEGELIISGTDGYVYVPAPWWKMDYFEIRYENPQENKRYFYQLDGEGIRYEIVAFIKAIETGKYSKYMSKDISIAFCHIIEDFFKRKDFYEIF